MRIGIPKEIKTLEGRVALIPPAAAELVRAGHELLVEAGAGEASGYPDALYTDAGVRIVPDAAALYGEATLVVKVKEPIEAEYGLLRADHIVFSYLHLAAVPELATVLCDKGLTAVAFETVEDRGQLPLLAPMSDIAGRLSVQIGATLLHRPNGGRGLLLGGMPAGERGHVVVLGAGSAGGNAVAVASELGARVTVFARSRSSLARMHAVGPNVTALPSFGPLVEAAVKDADLLVGAVLITGARAPKLVSEALVKAMKPGAAIVDIAVDQGGCIATTRPTTYAEPTYIEHGVVHFAVTNMPGAVPRTASQALSASLLPYVLKLAAEGGLSDPALQTGINVQAGKIVHPAVKQALQ
ncbi:MAG: alanine dehydrogenase [Acidithiobacillales bacterium SG8_45]|nr:MAG: alanine dehydrogenase [Acidithiobacillales bacterium SG8_45]